MAKTAKKPATKTATKTPVKRVGKRTSKAKARSLAGQRTWREKLEESKSLPRIAPIEGTLATRWGKGTFVCPAPLEVDAAMKKIGRGKLTTITELRKALAKKHKTTIACPITTGIFAWIAAYAADEAEAAGSTRITPYWRTLKTGGEVNTNYPGGLKQLRVRLAAEGHKIIKRGKRYFVEDHEQSVVEPKL